jgi:serine/threonine-protein kinase
MIREGTLLAGKYRVERQLGAGGMGYVVAAVHEQLDQRVAVKLLAPELCENKEAVLRFLREARAAVRIQSEHVARVLDVDELEGGAPYMVMEFLSGQDLSRVLDEEDMLEARVAVDYVLQASEAVAVAHSLGVIHRDLKPANLFLTRRPDGSPLVKVLDFGISKAISPDSGARESLTAPQSLLGSPAYMSPEQVRRPKTVDTRTDIWSLGTILYELMTGEQPFRGDSPMSVLAAVVSDPTPSLRERRPDIASDLEAVVFKCLEKNPEDRYQTVAEFAQALGPHAPASSLHAVSRIAGILRSSSKPGAASSTTMRSVVEAMAVADTEMNDSGESLPPSLATEKQTHTDWEASQSILKRSQRRTRVAVAAAVVIAIVAFVALMRPVSSIDASTTERPSPASAAAHPTPPATVIAALQPAPRPPEPVHVDAGAPRVTPSEKTATPAAKPAPKPPSTPRPTVKPPSQAAAPPAAAVDPLDGRH